MSGHLPSIEAAYRAGFAAGQQGEVMAVDRKATMQAQDAYRLGYRDATGKSAPLPRRSRVLSEAERTTRIAGQRARRDRERSEAASGSR